jgi:hypothetical protein
MSNSPIDLIYWLKKNEILKEINFAKNKKEIFEYIQIERKFTFDFILETYTNLEDSYKIFDTPNLQGNSFGWSANYENDPRFDMIVKYISDGVYMFDFNFLNYSFDKNKDTKFSGFEYLNTLHKVIKDYLLPWFYSQPSGVMLYFNINNNDGLGNARKKVFDYLIKKYADKNIVDIEKDSYDYNLYKK